MMTPRLRIIFFNTTVHAFHFFGITGFTLGLALGVCLAYATGLPVWPVALCSLTGAGVLFGLSWLYKTITGREDLVYYQHEIAIITCCLLLLLLLHLPVLQYLDITLMGIGIFLFFGRMGCFSVGCCHGRIGRTGVRYTSEHVAGGFQRHFAGIPVFPVQLIESAFVFVIVIAGSFTILKNFPPGTALLVYTVMYGAVRFALEYFRGDTQRPYWQGFSEAQWTTLGIFAVSVVMSLCHQLPHYTWHILALPLLLLWMLATTVRNRTSGSPVKSLLQPGHVLEIARGLEMLENLPVQPKEIFIIRTSENVNISAGKTILDQEMLLHYTVSFRTSDAGGQQKNRFVMNYATANVLAELIRSLKRFDTAFELQHGQPGVFHILFPQQQPVRWQQETFPQARGQKA